MAEDNIQNEPIQIDLDIVDTQEVPEVQEEKKLKETLQKIKETATEEDPKPSQQLSLRTILGGDLLTTQLIRGQIWLFVLIVSFATIYVAFRHYNCTDQYILVIDEVIITKKDADEWTTITTTENNVKLTSLEAETIYEVRVRSEWDGVKTDFSDVLTFQTKPLDIPTAITEVNATEGNGDWYSIDGKKLNARPKAKGLYIRNGQKVVVK